MSRRTMESRNPAVKVKSRARGLEAGPPKLKPWLRHSLSAGAWASGPLVSSVPAFQVGGTAATPSSGCKRAQKS